MHATKERDKQIIAMINMQCEYFQYPWVEERKLSFEYDVELGKSKILIFNMPLKTRKSLSILFVSDFFLPNIGGVELHQLHLAKELIKRGHRVSIFTRSYLARSDCDEDGGGSLLELGI